MILFAPGAVTVAVAGVDELVILPRLMPTSPPRKLSDVPVTGPDADELKIGLMLPPTSPPTTLFGPVPVTDPVAVAKVITPKLFGPRPSLDIRPRRRTRRGRCCRRR